MGRVDPFRDFSKFLKMQELLAKDEKIKELLLIIVMYNTNLRVGDALSLRWCDVIDENYKVRNRFYIEESKLRYLRKKKKKINKKFIPMTLQLKDSLLNIFFKYQSEISYYDYIFRSRSFCKKGQNISWSRSYVYLFVKKYADLAGVEDDIIGAHSIRKTWAYHAYNQLKIPIDRISRELNHSSIQVTERYAGIDEDIQREHYNMVSKLAESIQQYVKIDNLPKKHWKKPDKRKKKPKIVKPKIVKPKKRELRRE
ncbi:MAG: tyrosine-type recombinase/integrase [Alphaproteobacteria bacterium]